ncbi:FecR family protein [Mucilaginibacter sp. UYCu711]|uniref:FecR family protein n=1 Tax=Mucilaginibacter sp. UYCu711 TaxID=3156339 RepID=UPI003D22CCD5
MNKTQFLSLLQRHLEGKATSEETAFLHAYYNVFITDKDVMELLDGHEKEKLKLAIRAAINKQIAQENKVVRLPARWPRMAAAATILFVFAASLYFLLPNNAQVPPKVSALNKPVIIPAGSNKAILTLNNGQQISLNDASSGQLAVQGATSVRKAANGQIDYQTDGFITAGEGMYNTLTTPRGGQYQMILADGTKVWLNASSSIRYPVSFAGSSKREVQITGEAYFEVMHNARQPFRVIANDVAIEDLGTEFNVNAYADEPLMRTTLVSGSIKIHHDGREALIAPGMEALIKTADPTIKVNNADVDEAIAWKNGQTLFTNENIQTIMRQVARWYDIDIAYEGNISDRRFDGGISRKSDLSAVLKVLKLNGINYKLQGRKIIIK